MNAGFYCSCLHGCWYFLVASAWMLVFLGGLYMDASIYWSSLHGCWYFLVASAWMLVFTRVVCMDASISWWSLNECWILLEFSAWMLHFTGVLCMDADRKEIILRSNSPWGFYPFQLPDSPKGQVARVSGELPPCMTRGSSLRPLSHLT